MREVAIVCYLKTNKQTETKASLQYVAVRSVDFRELVSKKKMFWEQFLPSQANFLLVLESLTYPHVSLSLSLKTNLKAVLFSFEESETLCQCCIHCFLYLIGSKKEGYMWNWWSRELGVKTALL